MTLNVTRIDKQEIYNALEGFKFTNPQQRNALVKVFQWCFPDKTTKEIVCAIVSHKGEFAPLPHELNKMLYPQDDQFYICKKLRYGNNCNFERFVEVECYDKKALLIQLLKNWKK